MKFNFLLRNFDLFNKIAGEGKLKVYDEIEKIMTRYLISSDNLIDFFSAKLTSKNKSFNQF